MVAMTISQELVTAFTIRCVIGYIGLHFRTLNWIVRMEYTFKKRLCRSMEFFKFPKKINNK